MLGIKTKICQIKTEKEKKNIEETATIKEKNFVGEFENVGLNKQVFEYFQSIKKKKKTHNNSFLIFLIYKKVKSKHLKKGAFNFLKM